MPKRRTKGDGGLYQRHDHPDCPPVIVTGRDEYGKPIAYRPEHRCKGRWVGTLDAPLATGGTKRVYVYGRTQAEAKRKLDAKNQAKRDGTLVVGGGITAGEWLTHWLDKIATPTLKPQTIRGYSGYVNGHLIPAVGRHRLADLRPDHIRAMHTTLAAKGLSPASVKQAHAILRKALAEAVYDGRLAVNPAGRVKSPSAPKNPRQGLALEQARTVLASTPEARWWLALLYGMRQGEVLGLRWQDVDFDNLTITIAQTRQTAADGTVLFGAPKSRTSSRTLPMLAPIEAVMRRQRAGDDSDDPDALIWRRTDGTALIPRDDYAAWHELLATAGAPKIALHAARNTAASLMEAAGIPDRVIAQILGHAQVQITHGYQHAEVARLRTELGRLTALVAPGHEGDDEQPAQPPRELPGRDDEPRR